MQSVLCAMLTIALVGGCDDRDAAPKKADSKPPPEVVIYTSVDTPVAEPILQAFQKKTKIQVRLVGDSEASKTIGLVEKLRAEKSAPRADVWWSNEIFHTILLANEGVLAPYDSPSGSDIPATYKDAGKRWASAGLRARVIAVTDTVDVPAVIDRIEALKDPSLKDKICMPRPMVGTTGGHLGALFVRMGYYPYQDLFIQLRTNHVKLLGGNSDVAREVGRGTMWVGFTDNDDITSAQNDGGKLSMRLPNQNDMGTLMIPSTVGLIAGARDPESAKKLIDYLLSPEVEQQMIDAKFSRWSVREGTGSVKAMDIDYAKAAAAMPEAIRVANAVLDFRDPRE